LELHSQMFGWMDERMGGRKDGQMDDWLLVCFCVYVII